MTTKDKFVTAIMPILLVWGDQAVWLWWGWLQYVSSFLWSPIFSVFIFSKNAYNPLLRWRNLAKSGTIVEQIIFLPFFHAWNY